MCGGREFLILPPKRWLRWANHQFTGVSICTPSERLERVTETKKGTRTVSGNLHSVAFLDCFLGRPRGSIGRLQAQSLGRLFLPGGTSERLTSRHRTPLRDRPANGAIPFQLAEVPTPHQFGPETSPPPTVMAAFRVRADTFFRSRPGPTHRTGRPAGWRRTPFRSRAGPSSRRTVGRPAWTTERPRWSQPP